MFLPCFSDQEQWLTGQVGRQYGRPNQGPVDPAVDRRAQPCVRLADTRYGRPAGRPDQRAVLSVSGTVDRTVDRLLPAVKMWPLDGRPVVHFWQDLLPRASFPNGL